MLFMGSTKYPDENAYDHFLSKHGGSNNAYTELVENPTRVGEGDASMRAGQERGKGKGR